MQYWYYVWFRAWPEHGKSFENECVITCILKRDFIKSLWSTIELEHNIKIKDLHVRRFKKL